MEVRLRQNTVLPEVWRVLDAILKIHQVFESPVGGVLLGSFSGPHNGQFSRGRGQTGPGLQDTGSGYNCSVCQANFTTCNTKLLANAT